MKKIHLLLIAFLISVSGFAQTRLTSPQAGSITVQNPGESLVTTYPVDKMYFSLANNNVKLYILGTGPSSSYIVANNAPVSYLLNGANGTDTATVKIYLMSLGVGRTAAGGSGGGVNPYPGVDYSKNGPLVSIDSKTPALVNGAQPVTQVFPLMSRTSTAVTVGTSSTAITSANAGGYMVFIQNNGNNDVWISIGGTAVLAAPSILLKAGGGSYSTVTNKPDTQAITGISTVSTPITVITY